MARIWIRACISVARVPNKLQAPWLLFLFYFQLVKSVIKWTVLNAGRAYGVDQAHFNFIFAAEFCTIKIALLVK